MPKGSRFVRSERVVLEPPGRPCTNGVAITGRGCPLFWLSEGLLRGTRTRWCYEKAIQRFKISVIRIHTSCP
ncbi:hypothetical protein FA13DRAFT_1738791 [Coprinellus micaceus]|uniref:Uncharacterized protein n=1 Tax=Coprinellus micaceus TaxID=71717 RepID=A0A4Y7SUR0_COPMI|nr:hypothetical protein FA13DRAFT_1738791 [Coprinellus micaceus]